MTFGFHHRLLSLWLSVEIFLLTAWVTGSSAPLSLDNVLTFLKKEPFGECILYHKERIEPFPFE